MYKRKTKKNLEVGVVGNGGSKDGGKEIWSPVLSPMIAVDGSRGLPEGGGKRVKGFRPGALDLSDAEAVSADVVPGTERIFNVERVKVKAAIRRVVP